MANEYLLRLRTELTSNARQFGAELRKELDSVVAGARTPSGATQALAYRQGTTQAALQTQRNAGAITKVEYEKGIAELDQQMERARRAISENLSRELGKPIEVKRPSQSQVRAAFDPAYRESNAKATDTQVQRAATRSLNAMDKAADARQREARAAERSAQKTEEELIGRRPVLTRPISQEALAGTQGILAKYRERLDTPGVRDVLTGYAGSTNALGREYGLRVGLADEQERANREQTAAVPPSELRAQLDAMTHYREVIERSASEQLRIMELQGAAGRDLAGATQQLARTLRERQLIEEELRLDATAGLVEREGGVALRRRVRSGAIGQAAAEQATPEDIESLGRSRAAQQELNTAIRAEAEAHKLGSERTISASASELLARKDLARATNDAARAQAAERGDLSQGTRTQQLLARLSSREGQPPVNPLDKQTFGQLIGSKAITTATFAASGAVLYGGIQAVGTMITESTQLQQELAIIQTQFKTMDDTSKDISFDKFRQEILDTSKSAGVAADQVALVERQLAGAFANDKGTPNFARAGREGDVAIRFSKLTKLPQQEITDSLTAIALAFDTSFTKITDRSIDLENRFGVLAPELIKFTADLAPLGQQLGFSVDQLESLGAVAQQASGKSGEVLAEQFGRILPALQQRQTDLVALFSRNRSTSDAVPALSNAFAKSDLPGVLRILVQNYEKLDKAQQNTLASLVGSRREAGAFYALLDRGRLTIDALGKGPDATGAFQQRWDAYSKTVSLAFDRMKRTAEEFGIALFESGIDDGLKMLATLGQGAADVALILFKAIGGLNDALGGLPGKILVAVAAWKILQALWSKGGPVLGNVVGGVRGFSPAGLTQPGGLLSPYTAASAGMLPGTGTYRPGIALADRSTALSPLLKRDLEGNIEGGVRNASIGLGAQLSPIIAAAGLAWAHSQLQHWDTEFKDASKTLDDTLADAVKRGLSQEEVEKRATGALQGGGDSLRLKIFRNFTPLGQVLSRLPIPGLKDRTRPNQAVRDETLDKIQQAYAERNQAQLDALSDQDLATIGIPKGGLEDSAGKVTRAQIIKSRRDLIARYKKNPKDDAVVKQIKSLLGLAADDPIAAADVRKAAEDYDKGIKAEAQAAAAAEKVAPYDTTVETATARYQLGETTVTPVIKALEAKAKVLRQEIAAAKRAGTSADDLIQQLAPIAQQINDTIVQDAQQAAELRNTSSAIATGGGVSGADAAVQSARAAFDTIRRSSKTTVKAKTDAAVTLIQAQQAAYQARIDAATDAGEKLRLLDNGPSINPAARQQVLIGQLTTGPDKSRVAALAAALNIGLDEAAKILVQNVDDFDKGNNLVAQAMVRARIKQLTALSRTLKHAGEDNSAVNKEVANLRNVLADLETAFTGEVDPGANLTPEDKENAKKQAAEQKRQQDIARLTAKANIEKAQTTDPVAQARIDLSLQEELAKHLDPNDPNGEIVATAAIAQARQAYTEAIRQHTVALSQANASLAQAVLAGDAVGQAQAAYNAATVAIGQAQTDVERINALANQVNAKNALQAAITDVFVAQTELAIAVANAAGDTVGAARDQLKIAQRKLADAQAQGVKGAQLDRLKAEVINQQANLVNTQRQDRIGDLDYLYEFDRITAGEYVNLLTAELAKIPETNKEARREIERKIKGIRDELNQNLQFNLPDIKIPLLYETRRLGATSALGQSYTDNRNIQIVTYVSTDVDGQKLVKTLTEIVDAPPRVGPGPRNY